MLNQQKQIVNFFVLTFKPIYGDSISILNLA